jgi:translocation and assembly module TamA
MARNWLTSLAIAVALVPAAARALDDVQFEVQGGDARLQAALESASLVRTARDDGTTDPRDLTAAALADYARLLDALYAEGYYGGVIHILIDGREAASLSPFSAPTRIDRIAIRIDPGPQFRFATAEVAPLPPDATRAAEFRSGMPARSTLIRSAVEAGISDWRNAGRAKADIAGQSVVADHRDATLDARIALAPGPLVRFGALNQTTPSAVRATRIARIAGLPTGNTFSPKTLDEVAARLRRTGAFSSVVLSEAETLGPGDTMDIGLAVTDEKPRRFGAGAELSSLDGLTLSAFWLHRNLLGGAERLRVDGEVSDIDGSFAGMDFSLAARLDIPAAFGTDTGAYVTAHAEYIDDPAFRAMQGGAGAGVNRRFSDTLDGEIGLAYRYSVTDDDLGRRHFSLLSVPGTITWDRRDDPLDATSGFYVSADFEPFYDLSGGTLGARGWVDLRAYHAFADDFVIAGRALAGSVVGASAADVPPDYLFFSGGGGTVRGFPYQSLGVDLGGGTIIGGRSFLGASGELRYSINDTFGLVGFADAGYVGADAFPGAGGGYQVGAGVGLRYDTGIGPVRLDVAMPVYGSGGDGVQFYVGIGQSF